MVIKNNAQFTPEQVMLTLAVVSYLGGTALDHPDAEHHIQTLLEVKLSMLPPLREGGWRLVWGPAVPRLPLTVFSENLMFVVQSANDPAHYAVVIRGASSGSLASWFFEDFTILSQVPWPYADESRPIPLFPLLTDLKDWIEKKGRPKISMGTAVGLRVLQEMRPGKGMPGEGATLYDFLGGQVAKRGSGVTVSVAGHSLGGALAPAVALWLDMTRDTPDAKGAVPWDPGRTARIEVYSFAGPPPGNKEYAALYDERLGEATTRAWNPFDVVPHGWAESTLAQLPGLYAPYATPSLPIGLGLALSRILAMWGGYEHVCPRASPLAGGQVEPNISDYVTQTLYQHTHAYVKMLGLMSCIDSTEYFSYGQRLGDHIRSEYAPRAVGEESSMTITGEGLQDKLAQGGLSVLRLFLRAAQVPVSLAAQAAPLLALLPLDARRRRWKNSRSPLRCRPAASLNGAHVPLAEGDRRAARPLVA